MIVAHENVRTFLRNGLTSGELDRLLTADQRAGLPGVTYTDSVRFHLNGENIHAFHIGPAHTNGDSFVHFRNANVIHTGDVFRTAGYPYVDGNASGSFPGIVAAYEMLLEISNPETGDGLRARTRCAQHPGRCQGAIGHASHHP